MSLNDDQRDHLRRLAALPRTQLCPCGWYSEVQCRQHCSTGTWNSPEKLRARIAHLYAQIDAQLSRPSSPLPTKDGTG